MRIELPVDEALVLATSRTPLPALVRSVSARDATVEAEIDLRAIEAPSLALTLLAGATGTVLVSARFADFDDGVATFAINAHARGLPAHKLLGLLVGRVNRAIADSGLPDGVLSVERGEGEPLLHIDAQRALDTVMNGMTVVKFDLRDSVIHLETRV